LQKLVELNIPCSYVQFSSCGTLCEQWRSFPRKILSHRIIDKPSLACTVFTKPWLPPLLSISAHALHNLVTKKEQQWSNFNTIKPESSFVPYASMPYHHIWTKPCNTAAWIFIALALSLSVRHSRSPCAARVSLGAAPSAPSQLPCAALTSTISFPEPRRSELGTFRWLNA
jgi:hypothetical protein